MVNIYIANSGLQYEPVFEMNHLWWILCLFKWGSVLPTNWTILFYFQLIINITSFQWIIHDSKKSVLSLNSMCTVKVHRLSSQAGLHICESRLVCSCADNSSYMLGPKCWDLWNDRRRSNSGRNFWFTFLKKKNVVIVKSPNTCIV